MNIHDLKAHRFLTPEEVAAIFRRNVKWVYRNASGKGLLAGAARRFNAKTMLFERELVERLIESRSP
ncbi:MAG TPA: hypothetical protein VLT84_11850 [Acidobacteriota bacterium]|nr:hypothetical protein [Acidobacteriota bacterium]